MGKAFIWNGLALGAQLGNGTTEIDCVPEDHGGNREIESTGAIALVFYDPIPNFSVPMKEQGSGERV